ncbi:MAG: Holliday junction resolvase [Phycisphaerae bacterium]|nr:Holliday junction resolvase [Phycisphaerae bacterium]
MTMETNPEMPIVLGIDPGSRRSGYAVLSSLSGRPKIIEVGVIELDANAPLEDRLVVLAKELSDLLEQHKPRVAALEGVFSHGRFPRAALVLGHARGVCLLECRRRGLPIESVAPAEMKRVITGSGRATKVQVQRAVASWCGLATPPEPNDAADALGLALFQLRKLMPQVQAKQ